MTLFTTISSTLNFEFYRYNKKKSPDPYQNHLTLKIPKSHQIHSTFIYSMRKDFNDKIHNIETQNIIRSLKREEIAVRENSQEKNSQKRVYVTISYMRVWIFQAAMFTENSSLSFLMFLSHIRYF